MKHMSPSKETCGCFGMYYMKSCEKIADSGWFGYKLQSNCNSIQGRFINCVIYFRTGKVI